MFDHGININIKKAAIIVFGVLMTFGLIYLILKPSPESIVQDTGFGESKEEANNNFKRLIEGNDRLHYGLPMVYRDGCDKIKDEQEKTLCMDNEALSAARSNADIEYCDKIKNNYSREYCYGRVAWDKNNITDCNLINDESLKNQCISDMALKNLDKTICANLREEGEKKECEAVTDAFIIEQKYQEIQKCFTIPKVKEYRHHCILTLVQRKGPAICDDLQADEKSECLSTYLLFLGITQNNKEICKKIILDNYKKVCFNMINFKRAQSELDSDSDGLDDLNEIRNGTDPFNPDTDADELPDGEEMFKYHTDSLNPDTDGDGYADGEEVKNGYDPNGPGKLKF